MSLLLALNPHHSIKHLIMPSLNYLNTYFSFSICFYQNLTPDFFILFYFSLSLFSTRASGVKKIPAANSNYNRLLYMTQKGGKPLF